MSLNKIFSDTESLGRSKPQDASRKIIDRLIELGVPDEYRESITKRINDALTYEPRVGVFGKTGAGKSSLCNALFGREICAISDVEACTRDVQEVILQSANNGITLLDVPGVGENRDRDVEYGKLYAKLLPELDLVLWVIKADDRAMRSDEEFYKNIVLPHITQGKPFFVVISQVDKIEPFREWDEEVHQPGPKQKANIDQKCRSVAGFLDIQLDQVVPVSAEEKYGLIEIVEKIVFALPKEKRITFIREVSEENVSSKAESSAKSGFLDFVVDTVKSVARSARDVVSSVASGIRNLFSWW